MRRKGIDPRSAYTRIVDDKVALGEVLLRVFRFHPLSIIPTTIHIHLHLRVVVTGRTNMRSLGNFQKVQFFRKWGSMEYISRLAFKGLQAKEPSIFTIQNVSCHHLSTRMDYFVLSRDFSNPHYQIISDNHNWTKIHINSWYQHREVTLRQFVTN
jgi:hypothetical protein